MEGRLTAMSLYNIHYLIPAASIIDIRKAS
jgi:hypothetical protein